MHFPALSARIRQADSVYPEHEANGTGTTSGSRSVLQYCVDGVVSTPEEKGVVLDLKQVTAWKLGWH
jgi:hypothetical protein